uniref:Secreted protein n=1 Tax=Steinernema glaseri TaxID=37863 RepID=A0A1I7YK37_9BILA
MNQISKPSVNIHHFCYPLIAATSSCLLSFFCVAHIWTLLQFINYQVGVGESVLGTRLLTWYFYRLFILGLRRLSSSQLPIRRH